MRDALPGPRHVLAPSRRCPATTPVRLSSTGPQGTPELLRHQRHRAGVVELCSPDGSPRHRARGRRARVLSRINLDGLQDRFSPAHGGTRGCAPADAESSVGMEPRAADRGGSSLFAAWPLSPAVHPGRGRSRDRGWGPARDAAASGTSWTPGRQGLVVVEDGPTAGRPLPPAGDDRAFAARAVPSGGDPGARAAHLRFFHRSCRRPSLLIGPTRPPSAFSATWTTTGSRSTGPWRRRPGPSARDRLSPGHPPRLPGPLPRGV